MRLNPTKPYLIRALHEWCTDNNYEPYILVKADDTALVPHLYIQDGKITLNISIEATDKLHIKNDSITFQANFNNSIENIFIPMNNVLAIYSPTTGVGMEFSLPNAIDKNQKSKMFSIVK